MTVIAWQNVKIHTHYEISHPFPSLGLSLENRLYINYTHSYIFLLCTGNNFLTYDVFTEVRL